MTMAVASALAPATAPASLATVTSQGMQVSGGPGLSASVLSRLSPDAFAGLASDPVLGPQAEALVRSGAVAPDRLPSVAGGPIARNALSEQLGAADVLGLPSTPEAIQTINSDLSGQLHPGTSVPFGPDQVTLPDGRLLEGVFPSFEPSFEVQLPEDALRQSDWQQFSQCNQKLAEAVGESPELAARFDQEQVAQIREGLTPEGYTWHHHQQPGLMQLVNSDVHMSTAHTGGRSLWGGGVQARA